MPWGSVFGRFCALVVRLSNTKNFQFWKVSAIAPPSVVRCSRALCLSCARVLCAFLVHPKQIILQSTVACSPVAEPLLRARILDERFFFFVVHTLTGMTVASKPQGVLD